MSRCRADPTPRCLPPFCSRRAVRTFLLGLAALLRLLQVKLFAKDDFFDCRWYEIPNRSASSNPCSDFRRRDIDFSINDGVRMRIRPAAAIQDGELNNCLQFGKAT